MKNPCFYYIRHGQTDWNLAGRCQGHADIPLNQTGISQAHEAAIQIQEQQNISLVVSSPLQRARKTAEIIASTIQKPLLFDQNFKERAFGSFEGQYSKAIKEMHNLLPEDSITTVLPADAEQWPQTKERAWRVIETWLTNYPEDTILFVGHGAVFRALHETLTGQHCEAHNARPYYFENVAATWRMDTLSF